MRGVATIVLRPRYDRVDYISQYKPFAEQAVRFNNFRPVLSAVDTVARFWSEQSDAKDAKLGQMWKNHHEIMRALKDRYAPLLEAAYRKDVPLGTWDGHSIFQAGMS